MDAESKPAKEIQQDNKISEDMEQMDVSADLNSAHEDVPGVTPEELRSAEFGNSVENVLFSRFLYEIGSGDATARCRAARGIGGIRHSLSVKALVAQYNRENVAQVRKECIKALVALDMEEAMEVVKKALEDKAPSVRLAALQGIYRYEGKDSIEYVLAMLDDENALVRCRAATCVGWINDHEYAEHLLPLLDDESSPVRRAVVEALGIMGEKDSVPALFERLADSDESVREKALSSLTSITGATLAEKLPEDRKKREELIKNWQEKWEGGTLVADEKSNKVKKEKAAKPEEGSKFSGLSVDDILSRDDIMSRLDESTPKRTVPPSLEEYHELERLNKELLVKIKEFEYEATAREHLHFDAVGEVDENFDEMSEDSVDIISIVRELERELDSAFDLKESLETELSNAQEALNEESSARKELEAQVELLEAQADLAAQLKEEIVFIKEDRNVLSRRLGEANNKMERALADYDMISEQLAAAETNIKSLQREKVDLEAQVVNLKDKVRDLADITEANRNHEAKNRELSSKLKATEIAKNSLELELTKIAEIGRGLREENDNLRKGLSAANIELTNLRTSFQELEDEKHEILVEKGRVESELSSLASKYEASTKVLDAAKKSLKDIRSAALRTTEHFKDRYYRPGEPRKRGE